MKSSQIVEVDKEQKQTKNPNKPQTTAGETIRDKAEYSVQWEIIRADSRIFFFSFLVLRLGKEKKEQQQKAYIPNRIFETLTTSSKQNQAHNLHPQIYTDMINR